MKTILIADSGSTKTDWALVSQQGIRQLKTAGMNPYFQTQEDIGNCIRREVLPWMGSDCRLAAIYFYGAGCTPDKAALMKQSLELLPCPTGSIHVASDMLAAARALCGHKAGIACILGTGSNSCLYDGKQIVSNVSPLGFIIGDEGSGAVMGKLFMADLLKNQLDPALKEAFFQEYPLTTAQIIDRIYRQPFPNRFLASFSPFIHSHLAHPQVYDLVLGSFCQFIRRNVMQYENHGSLPVHFMGSIAVAYKKILAHAAQVSGIVVGEIQSSPIQGLISFHQSDL